MRHLEDRVKIMRRGVEQATDEQDRLKRQRNTTYLSRIEKHDNSHVHSEFLAQTLFLELKLVWFWWQVKSICLYNSVKLYEFEETKVLYMDVEDIVQMEEGTIAISQNVPSTKDEIFFRLGRKNQDDATKCFEHACCCDHSPGGSRWLTCEIHIDNIQKQKRAKIQDQHCRFL